MEEIMQDVTEEMLVEGASGNSAPGLNFDSYDAGGAMREAVAGQAWPPQGVEDSMALVEGSARPSGLMELPFDGWLYGWRNGEDISGGPIARVMPETHVVIDDDRHRVFAIPPGLHCKWHTQLHKSSDGSNWALVFHVNHGRIGHAQVEVLGPAEPARFKGRRYSFKGKIKKIHKNMDGVVVIMEHKGKPVIVAYDVEHNAGMVKHKTGRKWKVAPFSL